MRKKIEKIFLFMIFILLFFLSSCKLKNKNSITNNKLFNIPLLSPYNTNIMDIESINKEDSKSLVPPFLKKNVDHKFVANIQQKLIKLGFLDEDIKNTIYDDTLCDAIKKFQRQINVKQNGICTPYIYSLIISNKAPLYKATHKDYGDDIKLTQQRLYELGYLLNENDITGYFNKNTETAIKIFERNNNLSPTGFININLLKLLYSNNAVSFTIDKNANIELIKEYQIKLNKLDFYFGEINGIYTPQFKNAVIIYQSLNSLTCDGLINASTRFSINSPYARKYLLYLGQSNLLIKKIQDRLYELNYLTKNRITGNFDIYTAEAIASFQAKNNLSVTGIVDYNTESHLYMKTIPREKPITKSDFLLGTDVIYDNVKKLINVGTKEDFIKIALLKLESKYILGDKGPNTFDCSGFVHWCLNQIGIHIPYMTTYAWSSNTQFERIENFDELLPGDLIVLDGHMGIVSYNQTVIDASSYYKKVVHRDLDNEWRERFIIGFRIFNE